MSNLQIHDYIVVGSGCAGAIAAQTLIDGGAKVTMLDVGILPDKNLANIPNKDYEDIRKSETDQYRYLIGDQASGVSWGAVGKGEQITPPRKHIFAQTETFIPIESNNFSPVESLGYGGLGSGWGLQSWQYSKADLQTMGLNSSEMIKAYEEVSARIGISGTNDDASAYTLGQLKNYQASAAMDRNHEYIVKKYEAHKTGINDQGFRLGRTPLALLTEDKDHRKKYAYRDMDFYSDNDLSAWRPWITVNQLKKNKAFTYMNGWLLLSFREQKTHVELDCLDVKTLKKRSFACRKLILATGALGSARVVLRSSGKTSTRLPILCNPYSYVPCIQPKFVGLGVESKKLGFTQLSLVYKPDEQTDISVASLYSYQSLMLFRIVRHAPLNFVDARIIMRYLMSGLVIMGIHHADRQSNNKYLELVNKPGMPTGDCLHVDYSLSDQEKLDIKEREKRFLKVMRSMGTYGVKKINPGNGASIHYAGTLPISKKAGDFRLSPSGRLHGTKAIYVADSSGFNFLPAQGLTFSLMANSHLVARAALRG